MTNLIITAFHFSFAVYARSPFRSLLKMFWFQALRIRLNICAASDIAFLDSIFARFSLIPSSKNYLQKNALKIFFSLFSLHPLFLSFVLYRLRRPKCSNGLLHIRLPRSVYGRFLCLREGLHTTPMFMSPSVWFVEPLNAVVVPGITLVNLVEAEKSK